MGTWPLQHPLPLSTALRTPLWTTVRREMNTHKRGNIPKCRNYLLQGVVCVFGCAQGRCVDCVQVCVVGPSGCGKTECIKTLAAAHREMGHQVKSDVICPEAMESPELLGYVDPVTRWMFPAAQYNRTDTSIVTTNFMEPCSWLVSWAVLSAGCTSDSTSNPVLNGLFRDGHWLFPRRKLLFRGSTTKCFFFTFLHPSASCVTLMSRYPT